MQAKTPTQIYAMRAQNQTAIMGRKHSYKGIDIVMRAVASSRNLLKCDSENLYRGFDEENFAVTGGISMPKRGARPE
jgi:hypothetical protein